MKTSKEMQIKILKLMHENVDNDKPMFDRIELFWNSEEEWRGAHYPYFAGGHSVLRFDRDEYRIKPDTITLKNGVEIPKTLDPHTPIDLSATYYVPTCSEVGYAYYHFSTIVDCCFTIVYDNKEDAITASKALFGIE